MKRILVLGGAGFIGSYIVRRLLEDGHYAAVVDNFEKYGFVQHDFFSHPNATVVSRDVRTMHPREFRGYDVVLCLAALIGGIRYFHKIPYRIARDNTEVLSAAIDATLAACPEATFVYFSSSMIYEKMQRPVSEEDARSQPVPLTNYGMQKLFGEYLVRGAHEEFGLVYLTLRPFNAVGSGELPEMRGDGAAEFGMAHVIPDFCYKALARQTPFEIFGDGKQVRTFTHARDIAEAVAGLLDAQVVNDDFNICGSGTSEIGDVAEGIWKHANPGIPFPAVKAISVPPSDVRFRIGVSEKLSSRIAWKPRYDMEFIIADTFEYVKRHCFAK
jgi:UDP-glucose 4-epimerase